MRLEIGHIVRSNYAEGNMRIVRISRGCTCPHVLDTINRFDDAPALPPHAHLYLRYTEDAPEHLRGEEAWMNYIDEATLRSYGEGGKLLRDRIIPCENTSPIQLSFA